MQAMWFWLALGSAIFAALTSILAKIGIEGVNSNLATAIRTVVVLIVAWGMVLLTNSQGGIRSISQKSWIFLILSGLATGASWLCYYKALQVGEASKVVPVDKLSNCEKDPFECLRKYRRRETIEFFFESGKQRADGNRIRVWSSECLMGRMFIQFVALCYYEHLSEQLRQIKQALASEVTDSRNETAANLKNKKKLLSWMKNTPVYLTLQWFDAVEEVKVSTKLLSKRWTTEITERDRLFLEKLGVPAF